MRSHALDLPLDFLLPDLGLQNAPGTVVHAPVVFFDPVLEYQNLPLGLLQFFFKGLQGLFQLAAFGLALINGRPGRFDLRLQLRKLADAGFTLGAELFELVARLGLLVVEGHVLALGHRQIQAADLGEQLLVPPGLAYLALQ